MRNRREGIPSVVTVPGYQVQAQLFRALHTIAFQATAVGSGRQVLIKLPRAGSCLEHALLQIKRELAIVAGLAFPGKMCLKEVRLGDGTTGLETDLDQFVPLRDYLKQWQFSLEDFLLLAIQLADNLFQVHRQGVICGRIYPDVLFLDTRNNKLYLGDLSYAVRAEAAADADYLSAAQDWEPLGYIAPEQTGRFNRPVDTRSDIYSAGVVLYEILTGEPPVKGGSFLEWFHALATQEVVSPCQLNREVPETVGRIVMRCLAVDPDFRYQSAYGLKRDLERCLAEWRQAGSIPSFELARYDVASIFRVSEEFYGRELELRLLQAALEEAAAGSAKVALVAGEAGVGKTRLLQEFRMRAKRQATFCGGKFQALPTEVSFQPLRKALEQLLSWIMGQGKETIAAWRDKLIGQLGANLSIVIDVVPAIAQLTGEQSRMQVSSTIEAQQRLYHALPRLVQLFATQDRPLVIMLDDLQWADTGALKLLETLLVESDLRHVLLIGTYRQKETPDEHQLWHTVTSLRQAGVEVRQIFLGPMSQDQVKQIVASTMHCSLQEAKPLSGFLYAKTRGNPLFVKELLYSVFRQGLIAYKPESGGWQWDLHRLEPGSLGGDVLTLLLKRLELLPEEDRDLLRLAACIGGSFNVDLLARLAGKDSAAVNSRLNYAIAEGLIQREGEGSYSFVHDKVHQAAYQLVNSAERPVLHYRLGTLLLAGQSDTEPQDKENRVAFLAAVNHLNLGLSVLRQRGEVIRGAQLNLLAGQKAKQAGMFVTALEYFRTALGLLDETAWSSHYTLLLELNLEYLECLYLCGDYTAGDALYQELLRKLAPPLERTKLYLIKILFATKNGFNREAIRLGLQGLRELGHFLPEKPSLPYIVRELVKIEVLLRRVGVHRLATLAPGADARIKAAMDLLVAMGPCVYNLDDDLLLALSLKICELSLRYGSFTNSCSAYVTLAMVYIVRLKKFAWGATLGKTALDLAEEYGTDVEKCLVNFLYGAFCLPWLEHARRAELHLARAKECGLVACDLTFAGYAMTFEVISQHFRGVALPELAEQIEHNLEFASRIRDPYYRHTLSVYRQLVRSLQGLTHRPDSFSDEEVREEHFLDTFGGVKVRERDKFDYYLLKGQLYYLLNEYDKAQTMLGQADRLRKLYFGEIYLADLDFFYCLTLLARYAHLGAKGKVFCRLQLARRYRRLRDWARHCPANFEHKYLLVGAEIARVRQMKQRATQLYEQAIGSARKYGYEHQAAIACECAARFHLACGLATLGKKYLEGAWKGYRNWGAITKVRQLETQYPWLEEQVVLHYTSGAAPTGDPATSRDLARAIDIDALLRATRILSREIRLEELLRQMMLLVVQDAGAEKAVLLLEQNGELYVEAELESQAGERKIRVLQSLPLNAAVLLPRNVVSYVARMQQIVVLDKADQGEMFHDDAYITEQQPASLLCLPIVYQNQLVGVLYLENRKTAGCFRPSMVEVLKLLTAQIAISIENARLYRRLQQLNATLEDKVKERTAELAEIHRETVSALVEQSRLEERNRIAREIHDTIGHTLTAVLIQMEAAKRLLTRDIDLTRQKIELCQEQVRRGLDEVRKSVHLLHEDGGQEDDTQRLEAFLAEIMRHTGVSIRHHVSPGLKLNPAQRHVIYRALQEGITNGIRHGHSRAFDFSLTAEGGILNFVLKDFGHGAEKVQFGFGLNSMRERVEELHGTLKVDSRVGDGFSITLTLP